jgi:putative transposase
MFMSQKRKTHAEAFEGRVAVEALKGMRTLNELSAVYGVHPTVIADWKRQLLDGAPEVFRRGLAGTGHSEEVVPTPRCQEIGRLRMELEWLKKAVRASRATRRGWIDAARGAVSILRQCAVAGLARSTYYCERCPSGSRIWRLCG